METTPIVLKLVNGSTQATLDFVVTKLREQGGPSVNPIARTVACMYLNPAGRRCAIGHLLTEPECNVLDKISSSGLPALVSDNAVVLETMEDLGPVTSKSSKLYDFFRDLQGTHDDALSGDSDKVWAVACADNFAKVARDYNLDSTMVGAWQQALASEMNSYAI